MDSGRYSNWKEYFEEKFKGDEFEVIHETELKLDTYEIKSRLSSCKIDIIWPNEDWSEIDDLQFYSSQTRAWSGESIGPNPAKYGKLTNENLEKVDSFLKIPLERGWTAVEYYFLGKLIKSISFVGKGMKKPISKDYSGEVGCLARLLLWPLLFLIEELISKEVIGQKRIIYIEPMKRNAR